MDLKKMEHGWETKAEACARQVHVKWPSRNVVEYKPSFQIIWVNLKDWVIAHPNGKLAFNICKHFNDLFQSLLDHSHSSLCAAESIGVLNSQLVLGEEIKYCLNLFYELLRQRKWPHIFLPNTRFGRVENLAISHLDIGHKNKSNLFNLTRYDLNIALSVFIAHLDCHIGQLNIFL